MVPWTKCIKPLRSRQCAAMSLITGKVNLSTMPCVGKAGMMAPNRSTRKRPRVSVTDAKKSEDRLMRLHLA
eukprot:Skav201184  [mRNA]  locus=scaffold2736:188484:191571:- [translate_table: standard]